MSTEKLSFTMRREFDKHKEEEELIKQLRIVSQFYLFKINMNFLFYFYKTLETKLKMTLPDDLASALSDGVVLCHLANHIRPRSVGSIHVPSPAVVS